MKQLPNTRRALRLVFLGACALGALASGAPSGVPTGQASSWLTREEFRARDGSLLPLYEQRYTDIELAPRPSLRPPRRSDYVDMAGQEVQSAVATPPARK